MSSVDDCCIAPVGIQEFRSGMEEPPLWVLDTLFSNSYLLARPSIRAVVSGMVLFKKKGLYPGMQHCYTDTHLSSLLNISSAHQLPLTEVNQIPKRFQCPYQLITKQEISQQLQSKALYFYNMSDYVIRHYDILLTRTHVIFFF